MSMTMKKNIMEKKDQAFFWHNHQYRQQIRLFDWVVWGSCDLHNTNFSNALSTQILLTCMSQQFLLRLITLHNMHNYCQTTIIEFVLTWNNLKFNRPVPVLVILYFTEYVWMKNQHFVEYFSTRRTCAFLFQMQKL